MHIPGLLGMPRRIYTYEPAWLGNMESDRNDWRFRPGHRHVDICLRTLFFPTLTDRRRVTILGRLDS